MATGLFGEELWERLRQNPETAALLADPEFKKVIEELQTDPSSLGKHLSDPRVMKMFSALSNNMGNMEAMGSGVGTANGSANKSAAGGGADKEAEATPMETEEDLSELSEEERSKKLAMRAKDKGNVEYKNRNFDAAIASYTEAIELDPSNMSFLTNRAAARLESGDLEGCIDDCKKAVKTNLEKNLRTDFKIISRAYSRMGNAYLKKEDYDSAIEAYQKSLVEFHDDKVQRAMREAERIKKKKEAEAYINPELSKKEKEEGNALFKEKKFPESIQKYTEAIKRNPKDAIPYSNRAAAYMKLGEFPMALKDCDRCLELDDKFVKAYIRKGNIHFYMKEYHKCLTVYEKGLALDPNNRELRQGLMKTQMKIQEQQSSGQVDEAQVKQAMQDPEIQQILQDPQITTVLKQMEQDPAYAGQAMKDPTIASKVQKLIAAGVLRVN